MLYFFAGRGSRVVVNQRGSESGWRPRRMCLLACVLGRIWWGTLAGLGRNPGSRHQPQRKLVKWPRNMAVGMLQGRGRACGVWIGGWGRGAGRLEGWRQRQPFRWPLAWCAGGRVFLCGFGVGFLGKEMDKRHQDSLIEDGAEIVA